MEVVATLLLLLFLFAAVGALVMWLGLPCAQWIDEWYSGKVAQRREAAQRAKEEEDEAVDHLREAVDHFAELAEKGALIRLVAGEAAPNVAFRRDEEGLAVVSETTLVEARAVRTSLGAYGGPSFRLAKGVSFRLGGATGTSESHEEERVIDLGTLVLTTQGLIFIGAMRTISIPLEKLIGLETEGCRDWLRIHREGKERAQGFLFNSAIRIHYDYDGASLWTPFHSEFIAAAIMNAKLCRQSPEFFGADACENTTEELVENPNPIHLCVTCRSTDLSMERGVISTADPNPLQPCYMVPAQRHFRCMDCGTVLVQVGDKYWLDPGHAPHEGNYLSFHFHARDWAIRGNGELSNIEVWQKYAGQTLYAHEWRNIANGGLSDAEIRDRLAPVGPEHMSSAPVRALET